MSARKRTAEPTPDKATGTQAKSGAPAEDTKPDMERYAKSFLVSLKGIPEPGELTDEAFHNANKVATLNELINAGYRSTGDVVLDGQEVQGQGRTAALSLTYSAPVVRAMDDTRLPAEVPNPRQTIIDMGGSTSGDMGAQGA